MTYEALALLLMIVGFALLVAEVFLPSGGIILFLCVLSFVASIWCAHKAWWGVSNGYFWTFIGALIVLIPGATVAAFRFLEESAMGRRVLLSAPRQEEVVPYQQEVTRLEALIGRRGEALTLMTPGGMVMIDGERLHAVSEGTLISRGDIVEVMGVRGTRVIVRTLSADPPRSAESGERLAERDPPIRTDPPLDFDFPQG